MGNERFDMDLLPPLTDEQIDDFHRDGFIRIGRILDEADLKALLAEEERFRPDFAYSADGAESRLLVRDQLCNFSKPVREFCIEGRHIALLGQLLGPDVAFTHTQFITKLPDATDTQSWIPVHQDDGYGTLEPPEDVTVWTALTDTNELNGCLVVVPGSHKGGVVEHAKVESNPALREAGGETEPVSVPMKAGEAIAFSGLTLHGSGPNKSDGARIGMHARYCNPAVRMMTEGGKPVLSDAQSWMVLGEASIDEWQSANEKFTKGGD